MKTKFYKNTNDYLLYISDPTFHDYFSLNCLVETETEPWQLVGQVIQLLTNH